MKLTPLDIRKQTFGKVFRGCDPEEVQAFLEMIAEEYERLNRENIELREGEAGLQAEVDRFRTIERTLQETLHTAQQTAEDVRENARKEGRLIVKEAEILGNRAIEKARAKVHLIRTEMVDLENRRDFFVAKLKALVQAHSDFLSQLSFRERDGAKESGDEEVDAAEGGNGQMEAEDKQEALRKQPGVNE